MLCWKILCGVGSIGSNFSVYYTSSLDSITRSGFYMGQYMSGVGNGWLIGIAIVQTDGPAVCIAINSANTGLYIASKQNAESSWIIKTK